MIDKVKILNTEVLSDNWYILRKITYEYYKKDGTKQIQSREEYDRGNGATILLYKKVKKREGESVEHEEENIEVFEIGIEQASRMIDNGEIKDGKTIMLLQYIKLHNIL